MGQRLGEQLGPDKAMADRAGKIVAGGDPVAGFRHAYETGWNRRAKRTANGHFHTSHHAAVPSVEKNRNSARPTRFCAGTKPTADITRLSCELSRLSPIAK